MNNCIIINGQEIELTEEQIAKIVAAHSSGSIKLADVAVSDTVKIGEHAFIVLEHAGDTTLLLRKDLLPDKQFGENNNYNGSFVDEACNAFADEIATLVGEDNVLLHTVDLTSDDGLKDYGEIQRKASLLTADMCRRYVEILDEHKPGNHWWLATAHSTARHENDCWVKCVPPSGCINFVSCYFDYGVRPFCILKSSIFVSK